MGVPPWSSIEDCNSVLMLLNIWLIFLDIVVIKCHGIGLILLRYYPHTILADGIIRFLPVITAGPPVVAEITRMTTNVTIVNKL